MNAEKPLRKVTDFGLGLKNISFLFLVLGLAQSQGAEQISDGEFRCFGIVEDDKGQPVANARVECYQARATESTSTERMHLTRALTTDMRGRFEFRYSIPQLLLLAQKSNSAPVWTFVSEPSEKELRLVIQPAGSFSGVVLDNDKRPVADAEVWCAWVLDRRAAAGGQFWESVLSGSLARKLFSTRSAADGSFRIERFPTNASGIIAARKPGLASPPTSSSSESWFAGGVFGRVGLENLQVVLKPTGSIEGFMIVGGTDPLWRRVRVIKDGVPTDVMVRGHSGQPVRNAQVVLKPQSETWAETIQTVTTTEDGRFRFPDVAAGHYLIRATGVSPETQASVVAGAEYYLQPGEQVTNMILRAVPSAPLIVKVRSKEDGRPIPGATITLNRETYNCDRDGSHTFIVPVGSCSVHVQKTRFQETGGSTNVVAGQTNYLEIALTPSPKITGVVLAPSGKPAAGAEITGFLHEPTPDFKTWSKSDGSFELPWHPNWDSMLKWTGLCSGVVVRDTANGLAAFVPFVAGNSNLTVRLAPGLAISGRVTDKMGQPVPKVAVLAWFGSGRMPMKLRYQTATDANGHFEINALPTGYNYWVQTLAQGYRSAQAEVSAIQTNQVFLEIILEREPSRSQ